jgi:hypothetical protein
MDEQQPIEEEPIIALDMSTYALAIAIQDLQKKVEEQALIINELVMKSK